MGVLAVFPLYYQRAGIVCSSLSSSDARRPRQRRRKSRSWNAKSLGCRKLLPRPKLWASSTDATHIHARDCVPLTYRHYSQGERLREELRDYINRLRYSDEVMRLIRGRKEARGDLDECEGQAPC
jgi:hypothetical protein